MLARLKILNRLVTLFRDGIVKGLGFALAAGTVAVVAGTLDGDLYRFASGEVVSSSELNHNFANVVPVGTIIAWHKSQSGTPALVAGGRWVECNGQVLNDSLSPYNGQVVPNLNGHASGANSPGQGSVARMHLRGDTVSGAGQTDANLAHTHDVTLDWRHTHSTPTVLWYGGNPVTATIFPYGVTNFRFAESDAAAVATPGNRTVDQSGAISTLTSTSNGIGEVRVKAMSVVWIMKIR